MKLTKQQEKIASFPVGTLLISAAAGSGKTSVMTQRITRRILSGELDLQRILVMTFTDAAAINTRKKIEDALTAALSFDVSSSERKVASEQLSLLPNAHISTIHAFCLEVIRNFGYAVKTSTGENRIEAGFSTIDSAAGKILFEDAVEDVLTSLYELCAQIEKGERDGRSFVSEKPSEGDILPFSLLAEKIDMKSWSGDFQKMVRAFGNHRNDLPLRAMIASFHGYVRSLPYYKDWIRETLFSFRASAEAFESSENKKVLMKDFETSLSLSKEVIDELFDMLSYVDFVKDSKKNEEYVSVFKNQLLTVRSLLEKWEKKELTWDFCVEMGRLAEPSKRVSIYVSDSFEKTAFLEKFVSIYEVLYYLTGKAPKKAQDVFRTEAHFLFGRTVRELEEELSEMVPIVTRFFEVLLLVDGVYEEKKREENAVDFSDYEHLALELLAQDTVQTHYRELFQEIYIDEYQDNSPIQDAIVSLVAKDNTFAVGDVKQSIYRFRHARPQIFMEKMKRFRKSDGGTLLELNTNFRSNPGVISFVNHIFSQILAEESGEIEYDESQMLFFPEDMEKPPVSETEILLLEQEKGGEEESDDLADIKNQEEPDKAEKEALMVSERIQELIESGVMPGEIAVLCRTNDLVNRYRDILISFGIPAEGGGKRDFFMKKEILFMENMMRVLDNFCQDIPLASVMRADIPKAGFTADELLEIRVLFPEKKPFHDLVQAYARLGENEMLRQRVLSFLEWIDDLRSRSMYLRISVLVDEIYKETDIKNTISGFPDAKQRLQNLEIFRDWANRYEAKRSKGLYRFVKYVQEVREKNAEVAEEEIAVTEENAVHCLTVHKSKGLEFPYVFVVNTERAIRARDVSGKLLLSNRFGIATDYINMDEGYSYPTHSRLSVETEEKRANLSEELRLFYVAMTRAEKKLFLTGTLKKSSDGSLGRLGVLLSQAVKIRDTKFPPWLMYKASSYLDLFFLALIRHPNFPAEDWLFEPRTFLSDHADIPLIRVLCKKEKELRMIFSSAPKKEISTEEKSKRISLTPEEIARFSLQLQGVYAFSEKTEIPAKVSVSELKRRVNDWGREDTEEEALVQRSFSMEEESQREKKRPINLTVSSVEALRKKEALSASERGTLLHSLFRYIDFSSLEKDPSPENLENMLQKLVEFRMIKKEHIEEVRPFSESVLAFSQSSLCRRMNRAERSPEFGLFREIPFSLVQDEKEEAILVQGMIDCWFLEKDGAVLIDYKSDFLQGSSDEKKEILKKRYQSQLSYYEEAIQAAVKLPVKEKYIWLIRDSTAYSF